MSVDFLFIFTIPQKCSTHSILIPLLYLLSIFIISGIIPCAFLVCCFHTVFIIVVFEHTYYSTKAEEVEEIGL